MAKNPNGLRGQRFLKLIGLVDEDEAGPFSVHYYTNIYRQIPTFIAGPAYKEDTQGDGPWITVEKAQYIIRVLFKDDPDKKNERKTAIETLATSLTSKGEPLKIDVDNLMEVCMLEVIERMVTRRYVASLFFH